jgi:dTDP-4-dehydrorhamnose 3,5-epimerase
MTEMQIIPRKLQGIFEIQFERITDTRGYFMRFYNRQIFAEHGLQTVWEQESVSFNKEENTLRGLHFQLPPYSETKLVRVIRGAVFDVFVDLRKDSGTYGAWDAIELTEDNDRAVYISKGFAHGFKTLAPNTVVEYKIDTSYHAGSTSGIFWNDPDLAIGWNAENPIVSERDGGLSSFADFDSPFLSEPPA